MTRLLVSLFREFCADWWTWVLLGAAWFLVIGFAAGVVRGVWAVVGR